MRTRGLISNISIFYLLALLFTFCGKSDEPVNSNDLSELVVEVVSIDHSTFTVNVQAAAQNAVQYHFFIDGSDAPEAANETGLFEYTFEGPGSYTIDVRAYGASGKYIKKTIPITIDGPQEDPVPLSRGYFTPESYPGFALVWQDEFNDYTINTSFWSFDNGDGCPNNCGWGNNELEYYRTENAWEADSVLTLEARKESFGSRAYTSAKLKTYGKKSFQYGRIDIRALLPKGQGIWPALWMLGNNINSAGWPACGEIDIMEMIGGGNGESTVYGTAHWSNGGDHASYGLSKTLPSSSYNYNEAYHVFSILWDENTIKWYMDDQLYTTLNISGADMSEFHQEHWIIFNVAVGGNWPGSPDATTAFPQQMKVDYIRVFQQE